MRRIYYLPVAVFLFIFAASFLLPDKAEAVPAFARQTGLACNTCHFQHFPKLNAFGRSFKSGGFTMVGGQSLIQGDVLSLPSVLNASIVTKIRYRKTNGKDYTGDPTNGSKGTNRGRIDFPDEAALWIGGRIGENIGFASELQMADETSPMFANFKMPVGITDVAGMHIEAIPFVSDGAGPQYSFELLNTGQMAMDRSLEHKTEIAAGPYIGTSTQAVGVAFVATSPKGFINYAAWGPAGPGSTDYAPLSHYIRAAITPQYAGWDLGAGIQWWGGHAKYSGTTRTKISAWALDAQAQGNLAGLPTGIYLTYGVADKSKSGEDTNLYNSNTAEDKKAWTALAEVGILPGRATVALGYRNGQNGTANNDQQRATTVAATFSVTQNVRINLEHSIFSGDYYDVAANNEQSNGDKLTTLMIFAAF